VLDRLLRENRAAHVPGLPPFQGGLAGYISYDFGRWLEPHARIAEFAPLCPDMMLHHYDAVAAFDHLQERAWIISTDEDQADRLEELLQRKPSAPGPHAIEGWSSNFTRAAYEMAVARAVEYILAGDIFQANISQCFSAAIPPDFDALAFYRRLRQRNPSTFASGRRASHCSLPMPVPAPLPPSPSRFPANSSMNPRCRSKPPSPFPISNGPAGRVRPMRARSSPCDPSS
jgi:para-aminobenzoate synthetase component 1